MHYFFKASGNMWGSLIYSFVCDIFHHPKRIRGINQTFIALIPKVGHLETTKHFRPISLCSTVYKLVTKIIANRLRSIMPVAIAPTQCGFIKE